MFEQIANVLEKAAAYIEAIEDTKTAEVQAERLSVAKELATKISEATGEQLDEETISKLAKADKDVLQTIGKLATESKIDEMGGPANKRDPNAIPSTGKEAVAHAEESLLNFIMSP